MVRDVPIFSGIVSLFLKFKKKLSFFLSIIQNLILTRAVIFSNKIDRSKLFLTARF